MSDLCLIQTDRITHVSVRTVVELETVFRQNLHCCTVPACPIHYPIVSAAERLWTGSGLTRGARSVCSRLWGTDRRFFAVLMGIGDIVKTIPYFLSASPQKSLYIFDCWEATFARLERLVSAYGVHQVFFSAQQAAEEMSRRLPPYVVCRWVPEGIEPERYRAASYEQKDIDVLQFGRRFDTYHNAIVEFCERERIVYRYAQGPGHLVFASQDAFYAGLARAKISICFPSSVTHRERSGSVSTMTQRYLQSMLSRCLIVGGIPDDMRSLFDYTPVIEADMTDPAGQIDDILRHYERYHALIERNYREVLEKHLWRHRVAALAPHLTNQQ